MEYVRVDYPGQRMVLLDDEEFGPTNQTLMVEEGHHHFALQGPPDYTPPSKECLVTGTLPTAPMVVRFEPAEPGGDGA